MAKPETPKAAKFTKSNVAALASKKLGAAVMVQKVKVVAFRAFRQTDAANWQEIGAAVSIEKLAEKLGLELPKK